jgi:hypothetical protein
MSNLPQNDRETRKAVDDFTRILRQKSKEEREALLRQARDEALAEELAEAREQSAREAAALREELAYDPAKERARARETAKSAALLLIMLLLILLLIAAATGRTDILPIPGVQPTQTLRPYLGEGEGSGAQTSQFRPTITPGVAPEIDALFRPYYDQYGGQDVFGLPVSNAFLDQTSGRTVQWFQRARLEYWPELANAGYSVLGSRVGATYIDEQKILFPTQQPFVNLEQVRYFAQTGHGLTQPFLNFWLRYDGMRVLGYPISDQLNEMLPDNQLHTVQYFERGRLEYHPQNPDPNQQVQLGLLGQNLYANPSNSRVIAAPTQVPLPTPAAPTPVPAPYPAP